MGAKGARRKPKPGIPRRPRRTTSKAQAGGIEGATHTKTRARARRPGITTGAMIGPEITENLNGAMILGGAKARTQGAPRRRTQHIITGKTIGPKTVLDPGQTIRGDKGIKIIRPGGRAQRHGILRAGARVKTKARTRATGTRGVVITAVVPIRKKTQAGLMSNRIITPALGHIQGIVCTAHRTSMAKANGRASL